MKKLFKLLLCFAAIAPMIAGCTKDEPTPTEPNGQNSTPATDESAGFKINELTETKLVFSLERGAKASSVMMWAYPTALVKDFIREAKKTNPSVTDNQVIESMLYVSGPAVKYEGTETEIELDAQLLRLRPDVNYTVLLLGILPDGGPGDVSRYEFRTKKFPIKGDPKVTVTTDVVTFMGAYFRYTINQDAYGYMRFATNTEQIDEFLEFYDEEALRDMIIATDGVYDQVSGQTRPYMPDIDANGNATNREGLNWGWEASGLKVTTIAIPVADIYGSTPKKVSRLDIVLAPVPEGEEAKFTVRAEATATTYSPFFEFEESCWRCFYRVLPADSYQATIKAFAGGEVGFARDMCDNGGFAMIRDGKQTNMDPLFQNGWTWMDEVRPDTEYVLVATGQNYVGLLNDKLTISAPFRTKSLQKNASSADVELKISNVLTKKATVTFRNPSDDIAALYMICLPTKGTLYDNASAEDIYNWLIAGSSPEGYFGDRWAWVKEMDYSWDAATQSRSYTYSGLTPGTDHVFYHCGQDRGGKITPLVKTEFTTKPSTVGPNPRIESMKAYNITPTSASLDVTINDQVALGKLLFIQEELLLFNPKDESTLRAALYDAVQTDGMEFEESLRGHEIKDIPAVAANKVFYLAVQVTGSGGSSEFRYMKVQMGNGMPPVTEMKMPMLSSLSQNGITLENAPLRTHDALLKANRKLLERKPGFELPTNTLYYRNVEEAQELLKQVGVYRPLSMSEAAIKSVKVEK